VSVLAAMLRDRESTNRIRQAAWLTAREYTLPKIASEFLADFAQLCGKNSHPTHPAAGST